MQVAFIVLGVVSVVGWARQDDSTTVETLKVGGRDRRYLLHISTSLPKETPVPLVLVFHGGGGRADHMERFSGFSELADKEGFVVAYPDAVQRNWNDGRGSQNIPTQEEGIDDIAFVEALLEAVSKKCRIDSKRVYATGISNGGFMSQYVAVRLSGRFAAVASVTATLPKPVARDFSPEHPVSVMFMNGTADPLVPFDGGKIARDRGEAESTRESVRLWVDRNGCSKEAERKELEDRDARDGCKVTRETWKEGKDGTEVILYVIEGGGHTWPGGRQYLPKKWIGPVCRDIDATKVIWEFFSRHAKP